jgi:hypothetical protein
VKTTATTPAGSGWEAASVYGWQQIFTSDDFAAGRRWQRSKTGVAGCIPSAEERADSSGGGCDWAGRLMIRSADVVSVRCEGNSV